MAVFLRERSPSLPQRLRRFSWIGLVGLTIAGTSLWGLRWARSLHAEPLLQPLPQDPYIQAYFNHSEASFYTEPYRHQSRQGDNLEQVVIDAVQSAHESVDVAVQELRLPGIAIALRERQQAGVRVRIILENSYRQPLSEMASQGTVAMEERDRDRFEDAIQIIDQNRDGHLSPEEIAQNDALVILERAGIPILDDRADGSRGSALMHDKFVVVDGHTLVVGSANFTPSDMHGDFLAPDTHGNANHLLRIENRELAQTFSREFALMWGDGVGKEPDSKFGLQKPYRGPQTVTLAPGSTVTVQFSPTSPSQNWWVSGNGLIGRTLSQAQQRIDIALFVFSDQYLSYVLEARHHEGVSVQALIDANFFSRNYSEGLDMMGVALPDDRCRIEAGNHPWNEAIASVGTPNLPDGDMLHHKFAVVDGTTVITGSQNWSASANQSNDENVLVIHNATVAAHFEREFERLYRDAALGVPLNIQEKIHEQTARCQH
ncbi:phospholipase D-like domain-containing protein [Leptolyngbya sp. FACHB-8]|uniref:phospholipase D-like domain-containing protein n=1 Tax=unclassified Leptolyngbya TaxID=2650499 RepID=UPI0016885B82|nr:phospholipase D-like domain-containing protein [Leptolyngbya sp. FACHB-8]MBD1909963.1 DUF1669 domain-containing protein [Leptolyngbya sp. FACHB-8]